MIKLTIFRNGDTKPIGYDNGHTRGHNDALYLDCNSRQYREITNIESECEETRERAKRLIINLLNKD